MHAALFFPVPINFTQKTSRPMSVTPLAKISVIANRCAHWCGNPYSSSTAPVGASLAVARRQSPHPLTMPHRAGVPSPRRPITHGTPTSHALFLKKNQNFRILLSFLGHTLPAGRDKRPAGFIFFISLSLFLFSKAEGRSFCPVLLLFSYRRAAAHRMKRIIQSWECCR